MLCTSCWTPSESTQGSIRGEKAHHSRASRLWRRGKGRAELKPGGAIPGAGRTRHGSPLLLGSSHTAALTLAEETSRGLTCFWAEAPMCTWQNLTACSRAAASSTCGQKSSQKTLPVWEGPTQDPPQNRSLPRGAWLATGGGVCVFS